MQLTRIIERSFHTETAEEREKWVKAILDTKRKVRRRAAGGQCRLVVFLSSSSSSSSSLSSFLLPLPLPCLCILISRHTPTLALQIEGKTAKTTMGSSMSSRQRAMSFLGAKPEPIEMTMDSFDMLKVR